MTPIPTSPFYSEQIFTYILCTAPITICTDRQKKGTDTRTSKASLHPPASTSANVQTSTPQSTTAEIGIPGSLAPTEIVVIPETQLSADTIPKSTADIIPETRTDDDNNDVSSSLPCAQRNQEEPLTEAQKQDIIPETTHADDDDDDDLLSSSLPCAQRNQEEPLTADIIRTDDDNYTDFLSSSLPCAQRNQEEPLTADIIRTDDDNYTDLLSSSLPCGQRNQEEPLTAAQKQQQSTADIVPETRTDYNSDDDLLSSSLPCGQRNQEEPLTAAQKQQQPAADIVPETCTDGVTNDDLSCAQRNQEKPPAADANCAQQSTDPVPSGDAEQVPESGLSTSTTERDGAHTKAEVCGVCRSGGKAINYCDDCSGFLCSTCTLQHKKMKIYLNHTYHPTHTKAKNVCQVEQHAHCGACTSGEKAEVACLDCKVPICRKCLDAHSTMKTFSTHSIKPLDPPIEKCGSCASKQEALKFCTTCDVPICSTCLDVHSTIKALASHIVTSLAARSQSEDAIAKGHPGITSRRVRCAVSCAKAMC